METEHDISNEKFVKTAGRVSVNVIIGNAVLASAKILTGLLAHSHAMVSDGIHTASDVLNTLVVLVGVKLSSKEADREHPFGHERIECVAAVILAIVMVFMGIGIGSEALGHIIKGDYEEMARPGMLALIVAVCSIIVKEAMFVYMSINARKIDSGALMASAWHNHIDALSSLSAFIGIGGAMMGFAVMEPLASLVIGCFILRAAYKIFKTSFQKMIDHSCDPEIQSSIYEMLLKDKRVIDVKALRTRSFGNRIYAETEIILESSLSFSEAYGISVELAETVEENLEKLKKINVYIIPSGEE